MNSPVSATAEATPVSATAEATPEPTRRRVTFSPNTKEHDGPTEFQKLYLELLEVWAVTFEDRKLLKVRQTIDSWEQNEPGFTQYLSQRLRREVDRFNALLSENRDAMMGIGTTLKLRPGHYSSLLTFHNTVLQLRAQQILRNSIMEGVVMPTPSQESKTQEPDNVFWPCVPQGDISISIWNWSPPKTVSGASWNHQEDNDRIAWKKYMQEAVPSAPSPTSPPRLRRQVAMASPCTACGYISNFVMCPRCKPPRLRRQLAVASSCSHCGFYSNDASCRMCFP